VKENVMLSWYHLLWRVATRAGAAPDPGRRRKTVRPKVEGLEERWTPSGGTIVAITPAACWNGKQGGQVLTDFSAPADVQVMISAPGSPALMFYTDKHGDRQQVGVNLQVRDPNHPEHVEIELKDGHDLHPMDLGPHHLRFKLGPREFLTVTVEVVKKHRKTPPRTPPTPIPPIPPTPTPPPPQPGTFGGGYGGGFGGGGKGFGFGGGFGV
jgi:hypothetical protein